jgi:translation elongation factor EF-4
VTGTITPGGNKQILDKLDVERERGITVKAQTCTMLYNYKVLCIGSSIYMGTDERYREKIT